MYPSDFEYPIFVMPLSYVKRYNNEKEGLKAYYWQILEKGIANNVLNLECPEYYSYSDLSHISESILQFCYSA